jgi:hypothetical protein
MIFKELEVQWALGELLKQMNLIPTDGESEDQFFLNVYWKAQLHTFFNAEIWNGITDEQTIRRRIDEIFSRLKEQLVVLSRLEQDELNKERFEKIIKTITNFDSSNGLLTDVIARIEKMNRDS